MVEAYLKSEKEDVLEKLDHKLEILKRIQERDVRKQYTHNYTQTESNDHLKRLTEIVNERTKAIREIEKQIEEIKTS